MGGLVIKLGEVSSFTTLLVIINSAMVAESIFNAILAQRILLISGAIFILFVH